MERYRLSRVIYDLEHMKSRTAEQDAVLTRARADYKARPLHFGGGEDSSLTVKGKKARARVAEEKDSE